MSFRVICAAVAGVIACLVVGCNQGKPMTGIKLSGGPKWDAEPAERRLAEFSKSLDALATRISLVEDQKPPYEKRLDIATAVLEEHDRVTDQLTAVNKDLETALKSDVDLARFTSYRDQFKKEFDRYSKLDERLSKAVEQIPKGRQKEKDKDGK